MAIGHYLYTPTIYGYHLLLQLAKTPHTFYDFTNTTTFTNSTINVPENALASIPVQISGKSAPNIKTMKVKTNYDGDWSLEYTPRTGGVHTVTVSLENHYMYKDFTNSTTFNASDNRIYTNSTINLPEETIANKEFMISDCVTPDKHVVSMTCLPMDFRVKDDENNTVIHKYGY